MARLCGNGILGLALIVLICGCTNLQFAGKSPFKTQLNLKPVGAPEVLTTPPKEARYSRSQFPELAFRGMDAKFNKPLDGSNDVVRAQGISAAPGGGGGMPGGGMGSPGMSGIR
jgi:hypothetical protein